MELDAFLECVRDYRIPPSAPDCCSLDTLHWFSAFSKEWDARHEVTTLGMWALVTQDLARRLAEYIGGRSVLEIMSGVGWLARALADQGVDITATDDYSWDSGYKDRRFLCRVERMDCVDAVRAFEDAEILLVSWPHMFADALVDAVLAWGSDRPIIYIGESEGGCCACDEFFKLFREDEGVEIPLMSWNSIHDSVWIGHVGA